MRPLTTPSSDDGSWTYDVDDELTKWQEERRCDVQDVKMVKLCPRTTATIVSFYRRWKTKLHWSTDSNFERILIVPRPHWTSHSFGNLASHAWCQSSNPCMERRFGRNASRGEMIGRNGWMGFWLLCLDYTIEVLYIFLFWVILPVATREYFMRSSLLFL